MEEFS
jgi:ABC transporter transmembrane region